MIQPFPFAFFVTSNFFYLLFNNNQPSFSLANECCLSLIQAKHLPYDLFIHFGPACLSQDLQTLPKVHYIFPKTTIFPLEPLKIQILTILKDITENNKVLVLLDQDLQYLDKEIFGLFPIENKNIFTSYMPKSSIEITKESFYLFLGYYSCFIFEKQPPPFIIFIGSPLSQSLLKIGLLLGRYKHKGFYVLSENGILNDNNIKDCNKELMKRFALIEKAKEKEIFGILINTPTLLAFQKAFIRVKELLTKSKKKYYMVAMNNITEAKLGNFPDIEVFVILSCSNHSLYAEKDLYRIVITPYELELVLNDGKEWENSIVLDYKNMDFTKEKEINDNFQNEESKSDSNEMVLKGANDIIQIQKHLQVILLIN